MRAAIIVALLLQSSIVYAQEIEGFAGVKWGDSCQTAMKTLADKWPYERTAATFRQELADGDGCKTSLVSITKIGTWEGDTEAIFGWLIGGTPVTVRMVINPTAGLKRGTRGLVEAFVMFRSSYYQKILDAFSGAYGPPDRTGELPWQNAMGAQFVNHITVWERSSASIHMNRYGSEITDGGLTIITNEWRQWRIDHLKEKRKSAVEDIK